MGGETKERGWPSGLGHLGWHARERREVGRVEFLQMVFEIPKFALVWGGL